MEGYLSENMTMKQLAAPQDANANAITGARVKLEKGFRLAIVVSMGDSTAGVTDFTIQQHDAATGGDSKALATTGAYYKKVAAETIFTKVEYTSATSNFVPTDFANDEGVIVFEVLAEDLDRDNDYAYVSCNIADSTAAKIFGGLYILHDVRNKPAYKLAI